MKRSFRHLLMTEKKDIEVKPTGICNVLPQDTTGIETCCGVIAVQGLRQSLSANLVAEQNYGQKFCFVLAKIFLLREKIPFPKKKIKKKKSFVTEK